MFSLGKFSCLGDGFKTIRILSKLQLIFFFYRASKLFSKSLPTLIGLMDFWILNRPGAFKAVLERCPKLPVRALLG